jgi:hypothetical protein
MEYPASSGKPNFCSGCGAPLGNDKNTPKSQAWLAAEGAAEDGDDDSIDEPTQVPHINELQIDIQTDRMKSVSMAEIFKAASMDDSRPQNDPSKAPRISKKKILDQLKK